jgi:LL-diaminopimelate aminotransferase
MSKGSPHFQKLKREYIFPIIDQKLEDIRRQNPQSKILNFGVGDISLPLKASIVQALVSAAEEMGQKVRGYGPSLGYPFLKEALIESEYGAYGVKPHEIFISEGTKADSVNLLEVFDRDCKIALQDPTYPSYLDACVIDGRTKAPRKNGRYSSITYLPCTESNGFVPELPQHPCDLVYLCSPSNPTGIALTRAQLEKWISYAHKHRSVLIIDAAYEAFITSPDVPRSIYELDGAKDVAIELRSFSKSSGFTGLRCAYAVVPEAIMVTVHRKPTSLNQLWTQRQNIKTNGVAYPIQRAAQMALTPRVQTETKQDIQFYLEQGKRLIATLRSQGQVCYGGVDCPYIWWKIPDQRSSWEFCDDLLYRLNILTIPGCAFGAYGEGFMRVSTFASSEEVDTVAARLKNL